ncbi:SCP2 sterol-binding domain-containing protein [Halomicrobium sp. IBSBa]|uniref:SCP2 sterol-binding domain-containing protein n=1 Tax=Halomicrobium sp. IBSBa TaxID=2778916 RepID=UPI001ABFFDED|nr:SCP2 sterol-binding domain-containing protein [Halomicrobium sp. IBSBa]MBO4247784.1 SCP2 sterol-binding domain-containing protein [Halomicrobium sp. IBSBa]
MSTTLPEDADEWVTEWHGALADRPAFAEAAADFAATFRFEITPDDAYDGDPIVVRLVVDDGACPVAELATEFDHDFALRGPYEAWKAMLRGELDAAEAVMDGPFTVEGNTIELLQRQAAVAQLVQAARDVETTFAY